MSWQGDPLRLPGAIRVTDQKNATGQSVRASALSAGSTYQATLKLFGLFPLKDVKVKVVDQPLVIPCGVPFGIKMYTDGVLVVSMSDVDTATGPFNPARSAGIKTGDVIVSIDGETVTTTEQVASIVEESGGKTMTFHIRRDNIAFDIRFTPALSVNESRWKAGLWVRDSSAGIGTLTFFDPESQVFGGLGHAVCDVDTGEILPISSGKSYLPGFTAWLRAPSGRRESCGADLRPDRWAAFVPTAKPGYTGSSALPRPTARRYRWP